MIGDDSTTSSSPSSPIEHREGAVVAAPGDGVARRTRAGRAATRTSRRRRPAACARRPASGASPRRGRPPASHQSVMFSTVDGDRVRYGPGPSATAADAHHAVDGLALAGPPGRRLAGRSAAPRPRRRRAGRTARRAAAAAGSSVDAGDVDVVLDRLVPRRPTRLPSTSSDVDRREAAAGSAASTVRGCTCRNGPARRAAAPAPGSTITSVRIDHRSEPSASAQRRGASTPNCQRTWFFARRRPVRVQHVALVEHGVGHRAGRGEAIGRARRASSHVLAGFLQQALERLVPRRQGPLGLEPRRARRACRGEPEPAAVRGSRGPSPRARPRPAAGSGLHVPRHRLRPTSPRRRRAKTVPLNSSSSGISPSSSACRYLAAGDLEVVGARRPAGRPRCAPVNPVTIVADVGPQERPQRVAPPRRFAEQLEQPAPPPRRRSAGAGARSGSGTAGRGRGRGRRSASVIAQAQQRASARRRSGSARAPSTSKREPSRHRPAVGRPAHAGRRTRRARRAPRAAVEAPPQPAHLPTSS